MKVVVNGLEMALRVDLSTFTPLDSDLSSIPSASLVVEDQFKTLLSTQVPRLFHEVLIYDDDTVTLLFGGYVNTLTEIPLHPVGRAWKLDCQNYTVRAHETATGSLNKSGITDSDRNFVIAIFRDALNDQAFSGTLVDDAIITANEPNWTGVTHTAFMSGLDWSYMSPADALGNLMAYVPNVSWTIGKDRVLRYGLLRTLAPFALHTSPNGTTLRGFENYVEEQIVSDHRNKMRRGGFDTAEVTAVDESSWAKFGRILDAGYQNDEAVPAADLQRRAYAELRTKRTKRRANFTVRDKGLEAGLLVDVVNHRVGSGTRPGVLCLLDTLIGRSLSGAIAGERGRLLITKVRTRPLGRQNYAYDVEAGDPITDFALSLPAGP